MSSPYPQADEIADIKRNARDIARHALDHEADLSAAPYGPD